MAQQNPGGQPPTFKSNVNRAKTKKWIEAKSYSYDGDDWGDVDDYDEYGGYEDPPALPPLAPRNTGLRQRGQSASQPADQGGPSVPQSPYGESRHPLPQQSQAERSFTQPPNPSAIRRQNSFEPDQERRAFSGGPPQQRPASGPYSTSSTQNKPPVGQEFQPSQSRMNQMESSNMPARQDGADEKAKFANQASNPSSQYRAPPNPQTVLQPNAESRAASMASNTSSSDFQNRRDFSPSALPHPLQPRASPSPNQGSGRPPRTTSLGQDNAPQLPFPASTPASASAADTSNGQQRDRASSSQSTKGIPFVRPADIYRRMEEEKQRERRSQESSRPSMESIPSRSKPDIKKEGEAGGRPRQMSNLNPVHERRQSELALEESDITNPGAFGESQIQSKPAEKRPTTSKRFEMKKPSSTSSQSGAPSLGPILPDVGRISSFGDSFGESFMGSGGALGDFSSPSTPEITATQNPALQKSQQRPAALAQSQGPQGTDLQHQPSLGFTSAVHRSFDAAQEDVPPTPSSVANSSVERSASGGTSVVSPIISRGPSTANEPWSNTLPAIEDVASPAQSHQLQVADQRSTAGVRRPSPSQGATDPQQSLDPETSPPFLPGHRRNMSTPSPDNSPARTPALDSTRHLRSPQEVELAETTPTPTESEVSSGDDQMIRERRTTDQYPTPDQLALSEGRSRITAEQTQRLPQSVPTDLSSLPPTNTFARDRPASGGSGRVQNSSAEKVGAGGSRPQSSHSNTTPRASMIPSSAVGNPDLVPPRPMNERMESFRPHLPGGWESSASVIPATSSSGNASHAQMRSDLGSLPTTPTPTPNHPNSQKTTDHKTEETSSVAQQVEDTSNEAFAAAASAGGALAASFAAAAAAAGSVGHQKGTEDSEEEWEKFSDGEVESARDRGASVDTMVPSDIPKPLLDPRVDKERSAAPTPLPKDIPRNVSDTAAGSDYFQGPSSSNSAAVVDHSDDKLHKTSHQLPPLSTDLQSQRPEYESDRLRREIVEELGPGGVSEPSTAESISPYPTSSKYSSNQSAGPSSSLQSGAAPRSYWNDEQGEADSGGPFDRETPQYQTPKPAQLRQDAPSSGGTPPQTVPPPLFDDSKTQTPAEPQETSQEAASFEKPQMLPHRFSWEGPLQELGPEPVPELVSPANTISSPTSAPQLTTTDFLKSNVYPANHSMEPRSMQEQNALKRRSDQSSTVAETSTIGLSNSVKSRDRNREIAVDSHDTDAAIDQANTQAIDEARNEKELPSYPDDGPEVTGYSSEKQFLDTSPIDPGSEHQKTPSPTAYEKSSQQQQQQQSPQPTDVSPPSILKAVDAPLPPTPTNVQPNMPTFRSLLALKTPTERIRAYNSTQEQFANLNSGLAHWLFVTTNDLPEHSDLVSNQGRLSQSVPGRKPSPRVGGTSGFPTGSNQPTYAPGFSPSGGGAKISGKEVQAKSKELLHSAGVFGGKGIVAGKGLFSKGKNKLRGASGTDKALKPASPSSSPSQALRRPQDPSKNVPLRSSQARKSSRSRPVSDKISTEAHPHPSEGAESDRNTPSEQSFSKGQLGDDERSSEDNQSAESATPEETGPPPPRSSSLFIGDKHGINRQLLPKALATGGEAARTTSSNPHQTTNAAVRNETHSPRSTNSSNKTPTQLSFDHSKGIPIPLERTESPQKIHGVANLDTEDHPSAEIRSQTFVPQRSRFVDEQDEVSHYPAHPLMAGYGSSAIEEPMQNRLDSRPNDGRPLNQPPGIQTTNLTLPIPNFSPLMGENDPGFSLSPDFGRDSHSRGLSIGSVPSAIDPERPPSPVSPFVPPKDDLLEERRGRSAIPKHHGIQHDFIEESSVERARRRSNSFSRPFQTERSSEDARPFSRPDLQDHPAFRNDNESHDVASPNHYRNTLSAGARSPASRAQAPEYQASGQGAPDLPPVEPESRSRRGSRSSDYFRAIKDSISPSRRSHTRERSQPREISQPPSANSPSAVNSPQSTFRSSISVGPDEKPRRSSIFGRLKTNNSSHSDHAQNKEHSATRASTVPIQAQNSSNFGDVGPIERDSPVSTKINAVNRLGQKLQRSSTTSNQARPEPDAGQKKRFSGIGSLFGRNPKRQSSDQLGGSRSSKQFQQYGKYTGRPNRPAQRFPLDEDEPDESRASPQQTQKRRDPSPFQSTPPSQPQAQPQRDLPAYVQDRMLRYPTAPIEPLKSQSNVRTSSQTFGQSHQGSQRPLVSRSASSWARFSQSGRSSSNRHSQPPAPSPQQPPQQQPQQRQQQVSSAPPRTDGFVSSPPLTYESRPTQRSWMEGTTPPPRTFPNPYPPPQQTETSRPLRTEGEDEEEESPPPPPPPKDERWLKASSNQPSQTSSKHARTGSVPMPQSRSPAASHRQSLPPLQTNMQKSHQRPPPQQQQLQRPQRSTTPSSTTATIRQNSSPASNTTPSAPKDKSAMTPEEKRKSRQEEIEKGHLTPTPTSATTTPVPTSAQQKKNNRASMQVLPEANEGANDAALNTKQQEEKKEEQEQEEEPPIVMSATSFPADMWQPEFGGWEGE